MGDFILGILGGTALLIYGVDLMSKNLEKASGKLIRKVLGLLTGKLWSAFTVGLIITALVQSSTAVTVITVGLVNAGLMTLSSAAGIIYGANIGTTVTAQLMAFSFKIQMAQIAMLAIGAGFAVNYISKREALKQVGSAIMGFGLMFLGIKILNGGVPYIQGSKIMIHFLKSYGTVPLIGVALGAAATALVQSSSAAVGLTLVLGQAGLLDLRAATCIMLGENIGTCITAQLASLTGNLNARRTAWAHSLYNVIGAVIVLLLLNPFLNLIQSVTIYINGSSDIGFQIANSHTIFNVLSAAVFLPINKYYIKFIEFVIDK